MGAGLKFIINETWTIGVEFGGRALSTDYLDDVSDVRVNYDQLLEGNGPLAARLSNPSVTEPTNGLIYTRGSPFDDWYYIGTMTLSYHFGENRRLFWQLWKKKRENAGMSNILKGIIRLFFFEFA